MKILYITASLILLSISNVGAQSLEPIDKTKTLTDLQKYVTQHDGTEPPFENEFWDHKEEGIYVDVVSGEPLFSSKDKFDSGSGWPSFTKPINQTNIDTKLDLKLGLPANSHLGHVFNDGPKEAGGYRYCINSAALRFVPKDKLEEEGYGEYVDLFKEE